MSLGKAFKWAASAVRVAAAKALLGRRLSLPHGGKPVYLGRGVRLMVGDSGRMELGRGSYLDDRTRLEVGPDAYMVIGEGVYMNTNCRAVATERIAIGARTMLGPNVCIYDHDHAFDAGGVHPELISKSVTIGERCWLGANAIVTSGVNIADRICVGGGCVVSRSLREPGVYVGSPARLVCPSVRGGGVDEENHSGGGAPHAPQRSVPTRDQGLSRKGA